MAKTKQKTNVEFLRGILEELGKEDMGTDYRIDKMNQGFEFVDAVEEELKDIVDLGDDIKKLEEEKRDLESQITEMKDNPDTEKIFLGLDTLHYRLEKGNLKIQMQLEHWAEQVQKQNAVVPV